MNQEIQRLEDVFALFRNQLENVPPVVAIETDSLTILEHTIKAYFRQNPPSFQIFFVSLDEKPYEPFISFIKEFFDTLSPEERFQWIQTLSTSAFVKDLLRELLGESTQPYPSFYEWYIDLDECLFFQKEVVSALTELILRISEKKTSLICIRCINSASFAFFSLFSHILQKKPIPALHIMLLMDNRILSILPEEQSYEWNIFFHDHQKSLLTCEFSFSDSILENIATPPPVQPIDRLYELLLLYQKHWAWRDVKATANLLLRQEQLLSLSQKITVLKSLSLALAFDHLLDEALFTIEKLLSLLQETNDIHTLIAIQRLQAYIYLARDGGQESALKIARQNLKLAEDSRSKEDILLAQVLLFVTGDITQETFPAFYTKTFSKEIQRFHPLLAMFVHSNYYFFLSLPTVLPPDNMLRTLKRFAHMAKKYSYLYRLSFSFHNIAILYSQMYDYANTVRFYKKAIRIRLQLGDTRRVVHLYNGFGYVYYAAENFSKAWYYYNLAAKLNIQTRDYHELCMTLMNLVQLEIVLHNYQNAEQLLSFLIDLKEKLGITTLPIHSNTKIRTLHTYLLERLGKFVPYYHQTTREVAIKENSFYPNTEEYAYFQWYLALYYQYSIDQEKTLQAYENAIASISAESFNYSEMEIRYDYLQWLKKNNPSLYEEKRQEFLKRLIQLNLYYYQNYLVEKRPRPLSHHYNFPTEHILETAHLRSQIARFQKNLEVLDFINQIQKQLIKQKETESLITESMILIKRYFLIDFLVCYLGSHHDQYKTWKLVYSSHELKNIPPDLYENIRSCFTTQKPRLVNDLAAHYMRLFFPQYYSVMYFPLFVEGKEIGCVFFANRKKENAFSEETFQTIHLAIQQINTMLENIIYAELLRHTAQTDMLTGCANRFALQNRLNEEEERAKRSPDYNFSVVFTDMDNFKYYNDHFGHSIGDAILEEIAAFLSKNIRKIDLIGRFGGDEFVIVLPETNHQKALLFFRRLYRKLEEEKFFQNLFEKYFDYTSIPPEKKLSISAGIADYRQAESLEKLLEYADIALYESKKQGKNKATVYKEK